MAAKMLTNGLLDSIKKLHKLDTDKELCDLLKEKLGRNIGSNLISNWRKNGIHNVDKLEELINIVNSLTGIHEDAQGFIKSLQSEEKNKYRSDLGLLKIPYADEKDKTIYMNGLMEGLKLFISTLKIKEGLNDNISIINAIRFWLINNSQKSESQVVNKM